MVEVNVLGELELSRDGEPLPLPEGSSARALLGWLAVHRGLHARSRVAGTLRPNVLEESARKSLRDAIWALRQALGDEEAGALVTERERVGLADEVGTDLERFRELIAAEEDEAALELARGEPLPGIDEAWADAVRDEVSESCGRALGRLSAAAEAGGDLDAAARWARRWVALDPLAEEPTRTLIRLLAAAGDRGRALAAYEELAGRLRTQLSAAPSEQTRELAEGVRRGAVGAGRRGAEAGRPASGGDLARNRAGAGHGVPEAAEISYADSDGVQIAYKVLNEGDRDLILVPGFVSHLEILGEHPLGRRMLERLCSFARVIVHDKREQGLSDRTGKPPTLEQGTADLLAVLDAVGSRRATPVGISEGGPMATLFAASHPDRTASLVLLNTYARLTEAPDYDVGPKTELVLRTLEHLTSNWGTAQSAALFAPSMAKDEAFIEWWGRLLRSGTSPRGARDLIELYLDIDVRDILPTVHAPTVVMHREHDTLLPAALGRYLADHIPNARFVSLPGKDHLFFVGEVDEIVAEIEELVTGHRSAREPERMLTTILFTDIVGSTQTAAEVGDRRWRELLETHHDVVRRELERHGGREVKTTGDGFLASFDGPARAVRCAQAAVERTGAAGIPIRAGVHTGECEVMNGDLGGLAVHIGARVGALAEAGEVLVTGTVRDLVVGSELRFEERGERELSGVPGSWRLFAVAGE